MVAQSVREPENSAIYSSDVCLYAVGTGNYSRIQCLEDCTQYHPCTQNSGSGRIDIGSGRHRRSNTFDERSYRTWPYTSVCGFAGAYICGGPLARLQGRICGMIERKSPVTITGLFNYRYVIFRASNPYSEPPRLMRLCPDCRAGRPD